MSNSITISKANPLLPTEDFWKLRDAGIDLISKLGSDFWTDYNTHDPGITILEAVSYAITDLGYRTGFDMKDLLAPSHQSNKAWENIFYTARQILHCNPLTISDYRKIIIDVKGVRNAWIQPSKDYEVPLLVDYQFVTDSSSDCGCGGDNHDKLCLGQLTIDENLLTTKIGQSDLKITIINNKIISIKKHIEELKKKQQDTVNLEKQVKELEVQKAKTTLEKSQIPTADSLKTSSKILEINGLYNVMIEYEEDILLENQRDEIRQNVASRLHRHRNLCEDFLSINAVDYDDFNVLGSFVLEENADPDKVLAQILFTIYKYFVPTVNFHTIEQMMAEKHLQVDEIFEGPALKHGFIDTTELEATDFFRDMRLSDIINSVMDIEGIKAITLLHIPTHVFEKEGGKEEANKFFTNWINSLKENRKVARLDVDNSTILFCKEREFITYNAKKPTDRRIDKAKKLFNDFKAQERQRKLSGHQVDLPVPMGENMELEDYFPVTYSLPSPYHVKEYDTIEDEKNPIRKIQQLQLKGYLLFFEQILGDYLSQLGHLRELFSFDDNIKQTYYTRVLTEINDLKLLIFDHNPLSTKSTYRNELELIFKDKYPQDKVLATFATTIQNLVEGPKVFANRRNHFLDHLLARFSEDMSEYERITRLLLPDNQEDRKLIGDKVRTLQDYIKISNYRAKALNYAPPMKDQAGEDQADESFVWNSENVSGVERRVGRLLGFQDISRRNLTPDSLVIKSNNGMSKIQLVNPTCPQEIWLESNEVKDGCCTETLLNELILVAGNRKNYELHDQINPRSRNKDQANNGAFHYVLLDSEGSPIAHTPAFKTRQAREEVLKGILKEIASINDNEGMHLVEHILLRPKLDYVLDERGKSQIVSLLDICLDPCDIGNGIDQNVEKHRFRFKISRTPADRCYDKMPWVLELVMDVLGENLRNILFNSVNLKLENQEKAPQKFKFYDSMNQRLRDLREYGSEADNYVFLNDLTGFELMNSDTKLSIAQIQFLKESEVKTLIEGDDNARKNLVIKLIFQKPEAKLSVDEKAFLTKLLKDNPKDKIVKPVLSLLREDLIKYLSFQLDLYCQEDPCDHNEDPYSFRTTIILPCWVKRFRDKTFRNLVEKTIQNETPAHIQPNIRWVGILEMRDFEERYYAWLLESMSTYAPDYEKVNPLVDKLNHIIECGNCEDDCKHEQAIKATPMPTDGKL